MNTEICGCEHVSNISFTAEMASQTVSPAAAPSAQVVGHAFVEQYYLILHRSPESVYKFYQDSSLVSRPEPNGVMTSVTTMQAINAKFLSLDYKNLKAEIKTADAQESHMGGVTVLVTGYLTGMDNMRRPFAQSFFLAPQDKGYFVLNDVFRYMDECEFVENSSTVANGVSETALKAPLIPDPEPTPSVDHHVLNHATSISEEYVNNGTEVSDTSDNQDGSVVEEEEVVGTGGKSSQNEVQEAPSASVLDDTRKKSYASIVMKTAVSSVIYVPTTTVRVTPAKPEQQSVVSPAPAPELETPPTDSGGAHENSSHHEEAESRSIYIRGLPLNAEAAQVEEEFKKFGPIKPGGVQVRSNRQQGFCFGFVEFESSSSMHSAIKASPVMIGGRQASIEEKRTTSLRGKLKSKIYHFSVLANGGGRGRFPSGRGNFRNDNFRGRGNFGNRGYGRSDFGTRGEFSSRGRGPSGRSNESYQRVDQNMSGRASRSGGMNQNAAST
ncbi:putative G3BP-like protein [Cinnamomum micranthum f. kanehirae]|uniref:Putative G3BP-like protein n=1 Tax=Cinnamomum micranthum f. kanehirae TaxID=337451 RepID=A0A443NXK9_9MAGN|nr:putative G3BP-like protein [Cinnamomum micranthum f. kanehirae]